MRPEDGEEVVLSDADRANVARAPVDEETKRRYLALFDNPRVNSRHVLKAAQSKSFNCAFVSVVDGEDFPTHYHKTHVAFLYILKGQGKVVFDGTPYPIEAGDCVFIAPNTVHQLLAEPQLDYLAIVYPTLEYSIDFQFA
jgi:quercetin dioxygenase-like cupin family protein